MIPLLARFIEWYENQLICDNTTMVMYTLFASLTGEEDRFQVLKVGIEGRRG